MSFFVSGASGYIALHIVDTLLSKDHKVVGTVRSQDKADKVSAQFKAKYPNADLQFEIVEDISKPDAFSESLKKHPEVKYVLHTASPFSFGLSDDNEANYVTPAVQGTSNMLKAIKAHAPQVTNVVVTASFAAILNFHDPHHVYTEKDWNPMPWSEAKDNAGYAYSYSKTAAEKTAWKFVEEEKPSFKLTTVCPPYVFGPQCFNEDAKKENLNTSAEIINSALKSTPETTSDQLNAVNGLSIDVRDVAAAHLAGALNPETAGKRLFFTQGKFSLQVLVNIINKEFPELNGKIAKTDEAAAAEHFKGVFNYDCSAALKVLGFEPISLEQTVADSVKQILEIKNKL